MGRIAGETFRVESTLGIFCGHCSFGTQSTTLADAAPHLSVARTGYDIAGVCRSRMDVLVRKVTRGNQMIKAIPVLSTSEGVRALSDYSDPR